MQFQILTHQKLPLLGILLAASVLVPAQDKPAQGRSQMPEGEGKATTVRLCGKCHGVEIVLGKPNSEEGWSAIIENMVQRGMKATDDELYQVVDYLTKNIKALPKIHVNKAGAKELEDGLDISSKEAEAIVTARAKGEFKSLDDLKKVPGIPIAKIEARKGLLVF